MSIDTRSDTPTPVSGQCQAILTLDIIARLVTRRSHTVVVARRQARRHRAVRTLRAVVLALALPSAALPRSRLTVIYLSIYLSIYQGLR